MTNSTVTGIAKSLVVVIGILLVVGRLNAQESDTQAESNGGEVNRPSSEERTIPKALEAWKDWATWNDRDRRSPPIFNNPGVRIPFWPSRLKLEADADKASWQVDVDVFSETWVPLPGSEKVWPQQVRSNDDPSVVVLRDGRPAVQLQPGTHNLRGEFTWNPMPQRIAVPREIGLLELTVDGDRIALPNWDAGGNVWLRRIRPAAAEKNMLSVQVYRVIEDGIPLWLRTEIELTVSGKSREEEIGWILPEGWTLATVDSPIPVAIDDDGKLKAQVRSGKWVVSAAAFCSRDQREIRYSEDALPVTKSELVAFRANPTFRLAELTDLATIDVAQTTFPDKWRGLPVYQWNTSKTFGLNEKLRGMGSQRPDGLKIERQIWLDENGRSATYHDKVSGNQQELRRLDAAESQRLGSVRIDGQGQLITANPDSGAHGVEIRSRNLNLHAVGEMDSTRRIPATGWQTDAGELSMSFHIPPGWRVFALFGADDVQGDWLTTWTLLDLFLLLIFSLAVGRIWGIPAGLVAFIAFGLAYHEPGAPRLTWLFLLLPLALLRAVPEGAFRKWIAAWKYLAITLLLINLVPFLAQQVQSALYPQLEPPGINYQSRSMFRGLNRAYRRSSQLAEIASEGIVPNDGVNLLGRQAGRAKRQQTSNLAFDPKARIQTGPGQPEWRWNQVDCTWSGPVTAAQQVRPVFISGWQHRLLTVVRIALLGLLLAVLLEVRRLPRPKWRGSAGTTASAAIVLLLVACVGQRSSHAQEIPNEKTLQTLRERLLEVPDAFPRAAEIPSVSLKINGNHVTMQAEIHAATQVAVPLPGRIPTWTPLNVSIGDQAAPLVRRKDDYLWIVLPPGVHQVAVDSQLPAVTEWEWTFLLKPRRVTVEAADWNVSGVDRNGVPEQQVFFSRKQQALEGDSSYDRKDFRAIAAVDRHLEIGLIWQVRNQVTRLSSNSKAISLKVPLLPGERVLTPGVTVDDGHIEVRLGAGRQSFDWNSELPVGADVRLAATSTEQWVERWYVVTSPVWNMRFDGLPPILSASGSEIVPKWQPWPGEEVALAFSKPEPVTGETVTVHRLSHDSTIGSRQRTHRLTAEVESSLGGEFVLQLDEQASVSEVMVAGQSIPARVEGNQLVLPIQPGRQSIEMAYRSDEPLQTVIHAAPVKLPVEAANVTSIVRVPMNRWVLWATGPMRGPAVQFWVILIFAVLVALALGAASVSPLSRLEWMLLAIGLTQVHVAAAIFVVAWLYALALRGKSNATAGRWWTFNLRQLGLVLMTLISLGILIVAVGSGLLGYPEMFIVGNGSSRYVLNWFEPKIDGAMPALRVISISVWFYRLLMLVWALWLSFALLRWLTTGWQHFSEGRIWRRKPSVTTDSASAELASDGSP